MMMMMMMLLQIKATMSVVTVVMIVSLCFSFNVSYFSRLFFPLPFPSSQASHDSSNWEVHAYQNCESFWRVINVVELQGPQC